MGKLDVQWVREQFPALKQSVNGQPAVFLDGPAGTQVPQRVIDAMREYFETSNANTCGAFATSRRSDAMLAEAHRALAALLGCDEDEVHFGQNMTSLTFALARSIGRELKPGDEIVVTTLDHDANVAPWRALEEKGVVVRQVDIHVEDCTLDLDDLRAKITARTRVVAVGYASNAVGTINPVAEIIRLAHAAGALAFIDAVHYAPHGPIDVRALDCDFLACSPYKFFGPHTGVMYGKREHLLKLRAYKVRPQYDRLPDRWEVGTLMHEAIAGVLAAVEYLAELGRKSESHVKTRREALLAAYRAVGEYERGLAVQMLEGFAKIRGLKVYGIAEKSRLAERVPTFGVRLAGKSPLACAEFLGESGIFTWDGNYFAINVTERLGVEESGGLLRIGAVHYNTPAEIERLLAALDELSRK
ncbi:MAG: cysteine desulfurase-like protein [Acidobacteria bacterium]|nr:cysteine desulfurase-like protein [Acidobacteriota bacterium]MCL5286376.1 cysteine desulfurase-like protein [Acidobacteriota bacterium]